MLVQLSLKSNGTGSQSDDTSSRSHGMMHMLMMQIFRPFMMKSHTEVHRSIYKGRTQSLLRRKKISQKRASDFDLMINIMTFEHSSLGLVLHQIASAENNTSGPVPQCSNDVYSHQFRPLLNSQFKTTAMNSQGSKLILKSCFLKQNKTSTLRQELDYYFPPSHSNAEDNIHKVVRLGINPMIQPEPEDLPKDNLKLEIAVLRIKKKCMDKGENKKQLTPNLRQKPGQYICCQNHKMIADIENDIMDPVMQCTTLPSHSGFSSTGNLSIVTEIHRYLLTSRLRDCDIE
ncbi:hypothetical protein Tco_1094347 [Tanacetum coccineum]|uniref:Ycf1 n=1 Tax=Tanacetum coccineum TaxID=301880 RepID=A0ABQ5IF92_9ASTR